MNALGLEENSGDFPGPRAGSLLIGSKLCPQCSVSVTWAIVPSDTTRPPATASTPPHFQWSPWSSNALLVFLNRLFISFFIIRSSLRFKRHRRLKMEGGWTFRHWRSDRGDLDGVWEGWSNTSLSHPLPVHCLQGWPEVGTSRGQGRLDPMALQPFSGSWYLDRIYNSSHLINLIFPSILPTAR